MKQLIQVQVKNDQQLVSARDLYKGLEIKKRFSAWWEQNSKEFEENSDFTCVPKGTVVQIGNGATKRINDYFLTIDMAKQLCLISRTEKGKQYRKYLIEIERKWNDPQEVVRRGYAILQNENTQLKIENKNLTIQLEESNKKANYLDLILGDPTPILITQIANDYGYSAISFNKLLNKLRIQRRVNGQWILYRTYMGKGYTTTKNADYTDRHGNLKTKIYTVWTQKGRRFIYDILKKNDVLPLIECEEPLDMNEKSHLYQRKMVKPTSFGLV